MKVLVTGGAGFIGSNIANHLSRDTNCQTIALDDLSMGTTANIHKGVEFVKGSVMDYELVSQISRGCDYIFHNAARSSSPMFKDDPKGGININAMGFMNVIESAKRNHVKKVIFASTSSIYNGLELPFRESQVVNPRTFYETSFYCREVIAGSYYHENGISSIGLRYFSVYGPNEKHKGRFANNIFQFIEDISVERAPTVYGDGNQTRDFTFVDDIVQANILAMRSKREFGIYNVGTGRQASFNHIIKLIRQYMKKDITPIYIPNPIKNYVHDTSADISLIKRELGYEPKVQLEEGIQLVLARLMHNEKSPQLPNHDTTAT